MQRIDNKSSFGIIARIYHSDLSSIMRNDCACRIIAKLADADAVSILLYDGEKDRLVNHGTYINADSLKCVDFKKSPEELKMEEHVLKYITVYDFLLDSFHDLGIPTDISDARIITLMKEFKSSAYKHFNYRFFDEDLKRPEFTPEFLRTCINNSIKLAATDKPVKGYHLLDKDKFYSKYKKKLKEAEEYIIGLDAQNLSGRLYYHTIAEGERKIEVYNANRPFIHHEDLMDIKQQLPKAFNNFLIDTLSYSLKKKPNPDLEFSYCYTGIPIWSGNRCLGVIRIMTKNANGPLTHDDVDGKGSRVRHATEMLGYFLDQSYAEQFVDDIYHDWSEITAINKNRNGEKVSLSRISSNRHNRYCSKLRKAMNSFGCILRLSNFSTDTPKIVGKSTDPKEFRKFVESSVEKYDSLIEGKNFNKDLAQYFPSTNKTEEKSLMKNDFRLIGISVELNYTDPALHKSTYYYCTKRHRKGKKRDSEYVRETTGTYIFKDDIAPNVEEYFDLRLLEQLQHFNINHDGETQIITLKHVLLMDIPALDVDGLITFQNTINRPFNLMDVRFAYGEMKRFGLEKSKANRVRDKAYGESAGFFVHGISHAVSLSRALLNELIGQKQSSKARKISDDLQIIMEWINNTVVNLSRLSNLNGNIEELHKTQTEHWNICKEIAQLCDSLSGIGNICKATKVSFNQKVPSSFKNTYINKNALLLVLFNMLENALKYSFCKQNKILKLDDYNQDDETTCGHVHVKLSVENDYYVIEVINWGCSIVENSENINSKKQNDVVKKFLKENPIASEFIKDKHIPIWSTSSGKGIPTMDKYATLLDGNWNYSHNSAESKTTFALKIKKS